MAKKFKTSIEKIIFQVRHKPILSFYDKLYKHEKLIEFFPDWQTDRLQLALKDYEKKHNVVIKHDSITYESDNYSNSDAKKIVDAISTSISELDKKKDIQRLGFRFFSLVPVSFSFEELNTIVTMKYISNELLKKIEDPKDFTITIDSSIDKLNYKLYLGPIKVDEIPNFIRYNINQHIDPRTSKQYTEMANIIDKYPKTSLYFDIDFHAKDASITLSDFYVQCIESFNKIFNDIINYTFKEKIK